MIENIKSWWDKHSLAERGLIALLGLAILVIFLWLGIWRPVTDGLAAGWERQGTALDRYGKVRAQVEALKQLPTQAQGGAGLTVEQLVSQTAAEAGFTLERVGTPGAGRISVSIPSARTNALLGWLTRIEAAGVGIPSISITPGTTEGTVAVQAVFQERAP